MKSVLLNIISSSDEEKDDTPYLPMLKRIVGGKLQVKLSNTVHSGYYDALIAAKNRGCTAVATTSPKLLASLLGNNKDNVPSIDDYAGSIIEKAGVEFLILDPLQQLATVAHGSFVAERYWRKLYEPEFFLELPKFDWELFDPAKAESYREYFENATFISTDIETDPNEFGVITCCGFTACHINASSGSYTLRTIVVPFTSSFNVAACRLLLGGPAPKVLQNGQYDIAHFLRYNIIVNNYMFDTLFLFHCWYSELPKSLAAIVAFCLRKWEYWKDESKTLDLMTYYGYNAKDCFTTAACLIALLREMPAWALANYKMEFPLVFPCILAESTGIAADVGQMRALQKQLEASSDKKLESIRKMVACEHYNPASSQQTVRLFELLGSGDIKSSGKIPSDKVKARHPLNKRIITTIEKVREDLKLQASYLEEDKLINGRITYSLAPSGTDTGRLASKSSRFSRRKTKYGFQIHNIPRDKKDIQIKSFYCSDPGFYLGEADGEQAEARDTAYLSGDLRLIEAVEGSRDYHGVNAERFFGVPYDKIVAPDGTQLDKDLRDLSKRTNHGSNYNMGAGVLLDTMGIENVLKARKILKLPDGRTLAQAGFTMKATCQFMLEAYAAAYPTVKGPWYDKCKADVVSKHMLVGPTGWTRWCFGRPDKSKRDLNRYVAHPSQSLNAMVLNKAWLRVFFEVWLLNQQDFKLLAQIHDSILFMYRIGRIDLALAVKKCMEITIPVKDTFGITRNLLVPVALKGEATRWSELKKITAADIATA